MPRPATAAAPGRRRAARASRRHHPLDKLITGFVGGGVLLVMLPKALSRLPGQATAMAGLQRYGWLLLLLALGLLAFRLLRRTAKPPATAEPANAPVAPAAPTRPARACTSPRAEPTSAPDAHTAASPTPAAPPVRPTTWAPDVSHVIEWRRFEALVEAFFAQAGFLTRSQSHGAVESCLRFRTTDR